MNKKLAGIPIESENTNILVCYRPSITPHQILPLNLKFYYSVTYGEDSDKAISQIDKCIRSFSNKLFFHGILNSVNFEYSNCIEIGWSSEEEISKFIFALIEKKLSVLKINSEIVKFTCNGIKIK